MKTSISVFLILMFLSCNAKGQSAKQQAHYYDSLYLKLEDSLTKYHGQILIWTDYFIEQKHYLDSMVKYVDIWEAENEAELKKYKN